MNLLQDVIAAAGGILLGLTEGVGHDEFVGGSVRMPEEQSRQSYADARSDELGRDERQDGGGRDPGERVGEDPAYRDGGVRERRGAGEPVRRADVAPDGSRDDRRTAARAGQADDEKDKSSGRHHLTEQLRRSGLDWVTGEVARKVAMIEELIY